MNFFRVIGKVALSAVSILTGFPVGGNSDKPSPVATIAGAVDEYKYTDQEKAVDSDKDLESTRKFAAPGQPLGLIGQVVDGANHAIRPWVTIELVRGLLGYRELPDPSMIHPFFQTLIYLVITFWFGGRTVVKDILPFIQGLKKK
jgi:hypothetical protein